MIPGRWDRTGARSPSRAAPSRPPSSQLRSSEAKPAATTELSQSRCRKNTARSPSAENLFLPAFAKNFLTGAVSANRVKKRTRLLAVLEIGNRIQFKFTKHSSMSKLNTLFRPGKPRVLHQPCPEVTPLLHKQLAPLLRRYTQLSNAANYGKF